jgi:peptidoglycan/LPS O-acetylase OafA/YrhL
MYYVGILLYNFHNGYLGRTLAVWTGQHSVKLTSISANILLIHGLIPSACNNVVPGGWSIGTEVIFYCLFPMIYKVIDTL